MKIQAYSFGSITIDGVSYTSDLIINQSGVIPEWWRKEGHSLCPEDIQQHLSPKVTHLIIGTGAHGMLKVPPKVKEQLESTFGLSLIDLPTAKAADYYRGIKKEFSSAASQFSIITPRAPKKVPPANVPKGEAAEGAKLSPSSGVK